MFWQIKTSVPFVFIDRHAWKWEPIQVQLSYYSARKWRLLSNDTCLLMLKSGLSLTNQIQEFWYSFD